MRLFSSFISQFHPLGHEIRHFMNSAALAMPVPAAKNKSIKNVYGQSKLQVFLTSLPCVLRFIESEGQDFDPTHLSDANLEAIISHIRNNCRPSNDQSTES